MMSTAYGLSEVAVASTPQQRFEEFLQSRGKRNTQQRRVIVDHVFGRHEHFDAEALFHELQSLGAKNVSRPTVYRTLAELVDAGLLRAMTLGGRSVYEHDYGYPQHDHLHCVKCDKLIEFHCDELSRIREDVAREYGFKVASHRLIISGTCDQCAKIKRPSRRLDLI